MNLKYAFFFFFLLLACSTEKDGNEAFDLGSLRDSLSAEIMAVHDDVMPKHLELQKLKNQIDERIRSFKEDSGDLGEVSKLSDLLDSAYISMNTWMYEYEPMVDTMTREEILEYYGSERDKIDAVKNLMLECLEKAQMEIKH
jgi:hypothetical protein